MKLSIYQVDAFTGKLFGGNPAAVCPLDYWLDDGILQNIAAENNLSETAFFIKEKDYYHIRWMTPTEEVPLCGHATLASSFVIFNFIEKQTDKIKFTSKSGELFVRKENDLLILDFPAIIPKRIEAVPELLAPFEIEPVEILFNESYIFVFDDEDYIKNYQPNFEKIKKINTHTFIITAKGKEVDFVSRVFAPLVGIDEDPVTGSAHTLLIPYWSGKLRKDKLHALQVSKRCGELFCENNGERVKIGGQAILFSAGSIFL